MKHSDYLKKKRTRETRKRIVSVIAAIVVFVTTYALVLPAITLDVSRASREPGMVLEQMQFKTTASAASVTAADSTVEVQAEETQVEEPADEAPAEEETIQEEPAESSEEETSAVSDEPEEVPAEPEQAETPAEPAQEEAPAAEAETEEVQEDKSEDSSSETASSPETDASEAQTADTQKSTDQAAVDQSGTEITDAAAAATTAEAAAEFQIPALDALDFDDILTGRTAFYYYHPENAEEAESLSSDSVDDWKKAGSDTVLAPEDFVRVYLSYEIPAGALNETNTEARYRLPADLELSDKQIEAINKYENGIAASKSGSEHDKYLGAEAIEGSRTPDEKAGDEYISATVKVEKIYKDGEYAGQDLIFTFIPYTVEKNQISYDEAGKLASEGRNVKGFFTFDLTTAQIDFEKTELETVEKEDGTTEEIQYSKAEVVFVKENNDRNIDEISRTLTLAAPVEKEEPKTLTSEGSDYTVTVSYTEDAQIPDNAELAVREIEKDSEEYASYLEQAKGAVDETKSVNEARFFDITILVDGEKVEPQAPVNVQITFTGIEQTNTDDTQLLHYKDDKEVEIMDKAEFSKSEESEDKSKAVDTVQFEAEGFSVYGIVGTETLTTNYITAEGDTYTITVTYDKDAEIPEGATLEVSELANDNKEYTDYVEQAAKALAEGEEVPFVNAARLFDISIMADGKKVEPKAPVEVKIEYANAENLNETSEVGAVHFKESTLKTETEVMDVDVHGEEGKVDGVTFTTDSFSIYAVVIIDKEAGTFVFEDEDYRVTVTYTKEANIPIGTKLTVQQIDPESEHYQELKKKTIETINEGIIWGDHDLTSDPRKGITDAVFFDIGLKYDGAEIEPDVPLQVKIEYKNGGILVPENEETKIIHFAKNGTEIIDDVNVELSSSEIPELKVAASYEYEQGSFSEIGSYSTGVYIENLPVSSGVRALAAPALRAASEITAAKNLTDEDHDGVYELSLSVTGQSQSDSSTTVNKSNVVLVIDTSGSMNTPVSYTPYTYSSSTYDSNTTYYGYRNNQYIQVWRYNNGWVRQSGGGYEWYNGAVYTARTRLDETKAAAITLVDALLGNNKNQTQDGVSLNDIVEISLVTFAGNSNNGTNGYLRVYNNTHYSGTKDGTSATSLKNTINGLTAVGGTNWQAALGAAKTSADTYSSQTGESTSVIFLTDGMPTFYGNDSGSGQEIEYEYNYYGQVTGGNRNNVHTSWTNARANARTIVSSGYTLYNIFAFGNDTALPYDNPSTQTDADYLRALTNYAYTTGNSTYSDSTLSETTSKYFFNASNTTELQNAFQAIINSITDTVGYGGVTVDDGVTTGVTNTSVTVDGSVNTNSFHYKIKSGNTTLVSVTVNGNTATFTSASTGSTATATGVPTTVTIDGTSHTNTLFTAELDGTTYKMAPASMDSNGKIVWELAPVGIIENGYTYELTFDVWPNQLSYDMVADLNNGVKTLDQIKADVIAGQGQAVWDQIEAALVNLGNGKYAIRTNYEQYVDYYTVETKEVEGQDPETTYTKQPRKELGPKDPVALTSSTMELRKIWEDSLDEDQLNELLWGEDFKTNPVATKYGVKLHVWKADTLAELETQLANYSEPDSSGSYADADSHDYMDETLGWRESDSEYVWSDELEVAPGTMIEVSKATEMGIDVSKHTQVAYGTKTYVVLESGHYYTVTEENVDRHFELNTIIYHPMLVDGVLSNVTFKADRTVETIVPMSTVDATNTLRGGINVQKKVFDSKGEEITEVIESDDTFKVKITMKNADGSAYENWDYRIYYGQNNPNGSWNEADQNYGRTDHIIGSTGNGGVIETNLYIGDVIRVINVPAGVTYSVQETEYDYTVYTLGSNYTFPLTTGGEEKSFTTDGNGVSYMISKGENDNFVADSDKKVVGNAASQAVVVNKVPTARIKLLKVGDSTTALDGVQFKIFYDEECTKPVTKDATGQAIPGMNSNGIITTDSEGYADLGTLAGTYYFQEVATKDGYNLLTAPVRVNVEKDGDGEKVTASSTQEGVISNTPGWIAKGEDGIWVVKVNNSSGVELPMTGGSGTSPYTLGGIALIMASALMYGFRMRRRERRLN